VSLKSYQLCYYTYVGMKLCAGGGIKCCEFVCLEYILINVYFNALLGFPVQLYAAFSNVVQKCA
jgi:hypothetical protein